MRFFTSAGCLWLAALSSASAQTALFSENFNGAGHAFTLNTTDMSSSSTANLWVVNNVYTGGSASFMTCIGFPASFTVNPTPNQPGGITGGPNSRYMHIVSTVAQSNNIHNANFMAADGFCTMAENYFARMSNDVSTVGFDSVELSFWWLCSGGASSYGEVYYSTNGGSSWTLINTPVAQYSLQSSWIQQKISLPAFAGQANLRFGFRFVNQVTFSASDPSFSVDDVAVTGFASASISANLSGTSFCPGGAIAVDYSAVGNFTAGNVFTAQLSDASGSFAAPSVLGTLASTATSGTINGTVPPGTPAGSNYRVRVVSSAPNAVGSDNGINLTVLPAPEAGSLQNLSGGDTICPSTQVQLEALGVQGVPSWQQSTDGGNTWTMLGAIGNPATLFPSQSTWYRVIANNTCGSDTGTAHYIYVLPTPAPGFNYSQNVGSLQVVFTNTTSGSFVQASWTFGDGSMSTDMNPVHTYDSTGTYTVTLTVTDANGCSSTYTESISILSGLQDQNRLLGAARLYPNPNQGSWNLDCELAAAGTYTVELFDLQGRNLQTLFAGELPAGLHRLQQQAPHRIPAGLYVLRLSGERGAWHQKIEIRR